MCGICGAVGSPELLHPVRDLIPLMQRRGPDDQGYWSDRQHCALGFRRLAILDLSPLGHQPMVSADGKSALVFNGEIYNFKELRCELEAQGRHFSSSGDSEVVLQALVHWGKDALERFRGMFALAYYETQTKTLLLARDHAGIKPLYFLHTKDGVVFASQYDQILRHPASRQFEIDESALGLYLRLGYIPSPFGLIRNTHLIPAGGWIEIDSHLRFSEGRHFSFPKYRQPELFGEEAVEAIDEAVTQSVKEHLVSDVPIGTFLSGGIDSPLVAAKIQAANRADVKAFTIGVANDPIDESADATQYAREIGISQIVEMIRPEQALEMLDDVITACGEPLGDFSIFPTLLVSRLARRHVSVMLSGDGGDELFWGYARRFVDVISRSRDFRRPLKWRQARWAAKRILNIGTGYPQLTWPTIGDWYRSKQSHLHDDLLGTVFPDGPHWPKEFPLFKYSGYEPGETAQWARWNEFTGRMTSILMKVDRASMHHSLEVRVPLLDRRVVETASRVDWTACLNIEDGIGKLPTRQILRRHVRHQTQYKRGFTVPMAKWLQGPLHDVFEDQVLARSDLLGFPIDQDALRQRFHRFVERPTEGAWGFWLLLNLALWIEHHFRPLRSFQ